MAVKYQEQGMDALEKKMKEFREESRKEHEMFRHQMHRQFDSLQVQIKGLFDNLLLDWKNHINDYGNPKQTPKTPPLPSALQPPLQNTPPSQTPSQMTLPPAQTTSPKTPPLSSPQTTIPTQTTLSPVTQPQTLPNTKTTQPQDTHSVSPLPVTPEARNPKCPNEYKQQGRPINGASGDGGEWRREVDGERKKGRTEEFSWGKEEEPFVLEEERRHGLPVEEVQPTGNGPPERPDDGDGEGKTEERMKEKEREREKEKGRDCSEEREVPVGDGRRENLVGASAVGTGNGKNKETGGGGSVGSSVIDEKEGKKRDCRVNGEEASRDNRRGDVSYRSGGRETISEREEDEWKGLIEKEKPVSKAERRRLMGAITEDTGDRKKKRRSCGFVSSSNIKEKKRDLGFQNPFGDGLGQPKKAGRVDLTGWVEQLGLFGWIKMREELILDLDVKSSSWKKRNWGLQFLLDIDLYGAKSLGQQGGGVGKNKDKLERVTTIKTYDIRTNTDGFGPAVRWAYSLQVGSGHQLEEGRGLQAGWNRNNRERRRRPCEERNSTQLENLFWKIY